MICLCFDIFLKTQFVDEFLQGFDIPQSLPRKIHNWIDQICTARIDNFDRIFPTTRSYPAYFMESGGRRQRYLYCSHYQLFPTHLSDHFTYNVWILVLRTAFVSQLGRIRRGECLGENETAAGTFEIEPCFNCNPLLTFFIPITVETDLLQKKNCQQ